MHIDIAGTDIDASIIENEDEWADWDDKGLLPTYTEQDHIESHFSVRNLAEYTGISKSQISLSLNRMTAVGLVKSDRKLHVPKVNTQALLEFIFFGLRYVFPAPKGEIVRGIATSIAAPVLKGKLMSSGDIPPVWSDPKGNTKGIRIEPLHPNIIQAVRLDSRLYAMLALVDAIRIGNPRERNLAHEMLELIFRGVK